MIKEIKSEMLDEKYYEIDHASGLKIYVMPKEKYTTSYAAFGTKFGSENRFYTLDGENVVRIPDGTAHFLEHKLFESDEVDAFDKFSQTGANANAFTSFDRTVYLFSCSKNFETNLETLLEFVTHPYFTDETVKKEQGIIGQEIKMYQDAPGWQATIELLKNLYFKSPVNTDIAGTVESISTITASTLYDVYNAYYNLSNMVLCIVGNVEVEKILAICDKCLAENEEFKTQTVVEDEPENIVRGESVKNMAVTLPIFAIGYKEKSEGYKTLKERLETVILNEILIGGMSPLYQRLVKEGLVNDEFSSEYFTGKSYACILFTGESREPYKVRSELQEEIERLRKDGIDEEIFSCVVKELYGEAIMSYNAIEDVAQGLVEAYFTNTSIFEEMEFYKKVKASDIEKCLERKLKEELSSISVVMPMEE